MTPDQKRVNEIVATHIAKFGWHCLSVHPVRESELPFTYSIGFYHSFGQPEILIFNQPGDKAHSLLHECANFLRRGEMVELNKEDDRVLACGYKVIYRAVAKHAFGEYLGTAKRYYGRKSFPAVVMFIPDKNHHYPWDAGYDYVDVREALAIVN